MFLEQAWLTIADPVDQRMLFSVVNRKNEERRMLSTRRFQLSPGIVMLFGCLAFSGCGSSVNQDTLVYEGNEAATKEHMQEVESEERSHSREVSQSGGGPTSAPSVEDQERANLQRGE